MEQIIKVEVEPCLFPQYMEGIKDGHVVLFTAMSEGFTIVPDNDKEHDLFDFNENWMAASREDVWKRFTGKIHISNAKPVEWYEEHFKRLRLEEVDKGAWIFPYPVLMKSKTGDGTLIVAFTDEYTGIVLAEGEGSFVGRWSDEWPSYIDDNSWEVFDGILELSN